MNGVMALEARHSFTFVALDAASCMSYITDMRRAIGPAQDGTEATMTQQLNPAWIRHNNVYNEGGEGFNPHAKYIAAAAAPKAPARMIAGKLRTHAEALRFAKIALSGEQKTRFLAEVAAAFPEA